MALRKSVSLGNLGSAFDQNDPVADLYGPTTLDGYSSLSFLEDTGTNWVRLFVSWNLLWPNPPAPPGSRSSKPYPSPTPLPQNAAQVAHQINDLDTNIALAKAAKRKVVVTPYGFPKWLNGTDPRSTTEIVYSDENFVLPADSVLMTPTGRPPNGLKFYVPTDLMYSRFVHDLMLRYHPGNPNRPVPAASIDAFELVNEPNLLTPHGAKPRTNATARQAHSTALMMRTAQSLKTRLNRMFRRSGKALFLLGPATADTGNWSAFSTDLINDLTNNGRKPVRDRDFGWSHHNYRDVEQIGQALGRLPFNAALYKRLAPSLYGPRTQRLRRILNGKWFGWGTTGDPDPRIFLTEGGARLEHMPGWPPTVNGQPDPDPNAHYPPEAPSNPAATQKRLQAYSVGGSAVALKRTPPGQAGRGVEMFTNFLFFDDFGANYSGLCDQYALARDRFGGPAPRNETSGEEERPSYANWKTFGL